MLLVPTALLLADYVLQVHLAHKVEVLFVLFAKAELIQQLMDPAIVAHVSIVHLEPFQKQLVPIAIILVLSVKQERFHQRLEQIGMPDF